MVEKLGAVVEDPVLLVEVDGEGRWIVAGAGEEVVDSARPVARRHRGRSESITQLTKQNISLASRVAKFNHMDAQLREVGRPKNRTKI